MIPELKSITNSAAKADPKEIAQKVQGMFTEIMLKAMEDSVDAEDGLFGNSMSSDTYRGMLRENLASAMSDKMNSPLIGVLTPALTAPAAKEDSKTGPRAKAIEPVTEMHKPERELLASNLPVEGRISSPQGWRRDPIDGHTRYHAGTDIAAPAGTPIRAVAEGTVVESGVKSGYGNTVVIETDDGRKMLYAHNNKNFVRVGDRVSRGDAIAEVGSSGRSTGPHVHFEVKF